MTKVAPFIIYLIMTMKNDANIHNTVANAAEKDNKIINNNIILIHEADASFLHQTFSSSQTVKGTYSVRIGVV